MKLLFPNDIFKKSIYIASGKKSITQVSSEIGVSSQLLICENSLFETPQRGDALIVHKREKIVIIDIEFLNSISKSELQRLKEKNKVDFLFVGQIIEV